MLPALGFKLNSSSTFSHQVFAFSCLGDVSNKMHIGMLFQFGKVILIDREEQFVILATV